MADTFGLNWSQKEIDYSDMTSPAITEKTSRIIPLEGMIAILSLAAIAAHLVLRYGIHRSEFIYSIPLIIGLVVGGLPLLFQLLRHVLKGEFGADLLAGISIVTAAILGEYLAGVIIVLMLSGGETLESFAVSRASSALDALAKRLPTIAHRIIGTGTDEIELEEVQVGDRLMIYPHEICPSME